MHQGIDKWQAAGLLGMSAELIDRVYGHHHPAYLRGAARAIGYRSREKLVVSLVEERAKRAGSLQPIENIGGPGRTRTAHHTIMAHSRDHLATANATRLARGGSSIR
jgi:hypothetical protein